MVIFHTEMVEYAQQYSMSYKCNVYKVTAVNGLFVTFVNKK